MARLFKLVSVLQSMRSWVILGVFPVAKGAAGRSSCTCLAACLGSELGGSKVWEWSPAGMPRWFSRRLRTFLSSPALSCPGGSLPSEALGAPRCPTAGGSAGRSAVLSRSRAKPPGASSHARRCARFRLFGSACLGCASWLLSLLWIRRRSRIRDTGPLLAVLCLLSSCKKESSIWL